MKAIVSNPNELIHRISQDQIHRLNYERAISTSIISQNDTNRNEIKDQENSRLDGNSLWPKLFIEALVRLWDEDLETSLDEFVNLCLDQYAGNATQCAKIAEFKRSYRPSDAIMWYTKEPFVYEILKKALRIQDINTIFTYRFLIHDISVQLDDEQIQYCICLEKQQ